MRKLLVICFLFLVMVLVLSFVASAAKQEVVLYDRAGLISSQEDDKIRKGGNDAMEDMDGIAINIIITPDFYSNYSSAMQDTYTLTQDQDMILLVVYYSAYRNYYEYEVVTFGEARKAISSTRQEDISDAIYSYVKGGQLSDACNLFIERAHEEYLAQKKTRTPRIIGISLICGVAGAMIATLAVVISYRKKRRSPSYPLKEFSQLTLITCDDVCTGRTVTKVKLPTSSGGSRGGGGRSSGRR